MKKLLAEIKSCRVCEEFLEHGVNPVLAAGAKSKLVIIGQAPGRIVHDTSIPWDDKSGDNLRNWLEVDKQTFYNPDIISLIPMGFCYPGTGKTGDMAPRPECAPLWHNRLFSKMPEVKLILLVGLFAQKYYLGNKAKETLTETVRSFEEYLPTYFPLPHPSPRNNIWMAKNKWFEKSVLPELKNRLSSIL
jgi:uracil-DNA glycosylase